MALGNYPYGLVVVPFSPTPTFDCSLGNIFTMTLTGNVISMSFTNQQAGHLYFFIFTQDGSGLHSIAWPSNAKGSVSVSIPVASTTSVQAFLFDGTNNYAFALGQTNL